jgi:hypothetical protein
MIKAASSSDPSSVSSNFRKGTTGISPSTKGQSRALEDPVVDDDISAPETNVGLAERRDDVGVGGATVYSEADV